MRTSVSEPAGPEVDTDAEGASRSRVLISGSPRRSMRLASMMVIAAGVVTSCSGAREAVMTIWLVSMGSAGMAILLLTNLSSQRDAPPCGSGTHAPRLVPAGETDDGPRQVPDYPRPSPRFTVAGTAPDSHRLPFEPPPPNSRSWAAPWSTGLLGECSRGCQIAAVPIMQRRMTANHTRLVVLLSAILA